MPEYSWQDRIGPMVRVQQIIVGAQILGALVFLVFAVAMRMRGDLLAMPAQWPLTYVLVAFAAMVMLARLVVPSIMVARGRRSIGRGERPSLHRAPQAIVEFFAEAGDAAAMTFLLQTSTIVSTALLEGVAFFGLIVYLLEGSVLALGIAVAMILGIACHFPTRSRVVAWVERQLATMEQERQFGG